MMTNITQDAQGVVLGSVSFLTWCFFIAMDALTQRFDSTLFYVCVF